MTEIGLVLFPDLTQLDLTGPYEVLTRIPDARVHLLWKTTELVTSDSGLTIRPTTPFADSPALDVLLVPGGRGIGELLVDDVVLDFLRAQAQHVRWLVAVCTGSLVLGAAGLLAGYRATSHWAWRDLLEPLGAIVTDGRVVEDRDRITGGGITAGLDVALHLAARLHGDETARRIQLMLEYDPAPPFDAGSPDRAPGPVVDDLRAALEPLRTQREEVVALAAARLAESRLSPRVPRRRTSPR